MFTREPEVVRWYTTVPQDPDGIPSYVHDVEFQSIRCWRDPTLLGRVLKCFSRLKILTISETGIPPDEVRKVVSSGEFGRDIISLTFISPVSTVQTLVSLALSLSNLRELMIDSIMRAEPPALTSPDKTWQGGPLESLELASLWSEEFEFIALCGVTTHRLDLSVVDMTMEKIIACSSETIRELMFQGTCFLWNCFYGAMLTSSPDLDPHIGPVNAFPPIVHLPPLPVITSVKLEIRSGTLSPRLADVLSCIRSVPALSSVTFKYPKMSGVEVIHASSQWIDVDESLTRLAMEVRSKRSLVVVLTPWPEGNSSWEVYLPEFRRAGGELRVSPDADVQGLISGGIEP